MDERTADGQRDVELLEGGADPPLRARDASHFSGSVNIRNVTNWRFLLVPDDGKDYDKADMRNVQRKLSIARGERPAELVFKNANVVNVLSGEIYRTNVAVDDGRVIALGEYEAAKVVDLSGSYLAPSL